jgi:DNA-binding MarR family transcriptional regulator
MGDALVALVHAIFLGLKRAYQSTLRLTRRCLAQLGLTAARFDMLHAVKCARYGSYQAQLCRRLGVTGATVSRMLKSLEELGLVSRERSTADRRRMRVQITEHGRQVIRRAEYGLVSSGSISFAIECALTDAWHDETAAFLAVDALDTTLDRVRRAFFDDAYLFYPWHPDE